MLNLSLLTCDFYSVFAGVFLFDVQFTFVYAIAFVLSASGILVYNSGWCASKLAERPVHILILCFTTTVPEPAHTQGRPFLVRLFHKPKVRHIDDA